MKKGNVLSAVIGISILSLTGCGRSSGTEPTKEIVSISYMDLAEDNLAAEETWPDDAVSSESQNDTEEESELENGTVFDAEEELVPVDGTGSEAVSAMVTVPQLPGTGKGIDDFVPEGWALLDSVALDFNEDGIADHVGVLETGDEGSPRILFAIASDGTDQYHLDLQNSNLIRAGNEGGVYGDPYMPLTAECTSFTTNAYGGSSWRWSEEYTYTYRDGGWWLTSSEDTYGYIFGCTTSYCKNDWESGVGIRKKRSSEFGDMEGEGDTEEYDVIYEMALDEPLTLEQAGWRYGFASDRVTDWETADITFGKGITLSRDQVMLPDEAYVNYCDEECMLYTFSDEDEVYHYLAMYRWRDRVLSVLVKEDAPIDHLTYYKGKIYYTTETKETVTYRMAPSGEEQDTQKEETVGMKLGRIEPDGTQKETIFEYRYPKAGQEVMEDQIPYLTLTYEISGDEIVLEVYIGEEPHPFYRMNIDGSGIEKIGEMPGAA